MNKIITIVLFTLLFISIMVTVFLYSDLNKSKLNSNEITDSEYLKLNETNDELQKLNLDIYFKVNVPVNEVNFLQSQIKEQYKDIIIKFISQEQALSSYRQANQDDEIAMQALEEVGENPFGAIIKIKTTSPEETKQLVDYIESIDSKEVVDRMNYKVH